MYEGKALFIVFVDPADSDGNRSRAETVDVNAVLLELISGVVITPLMSVNGRSS